MAKVFWDSSPDSRMTQTTESEGHAFRSPNLFALRALRRAASSSLFFGGEFVSRELRRFAEIPAIASIAEKNAASFALDGLLKPLI